MAALKDSLGKKSNPRKRSPQFGPKSTQPEKDRETQSIKMKLFTTGEVAKILNLPGSRIRSFVRAGFITPCRGNKKSLQFTFQDVLFLKTAKGSLDSRVPSKNIIRMLSALKHQLPDGQHLSSRENLSDERRAIVVGRQEPLAARFRTISFQLRCPRHGAKA